MMKHLPHVHLMSTLILALLLNPTTSAQRKWQQTLYKEWTLSDVEDVLTDSPWVQTLHKGNTSTSLPLPNIGTRSMGELTVRLRSGLPVRQAVVRMREIKSNYDRMSASEKASFDNKTKVVLECPGCRNNYIITLSPPPVMLTRLSIETLKGYVQLRDDKGNTRQPVHIELPKTPSDDAVFFFPRFNEKGEPLLSLSSKKFTISFDDAIFWNDKMGSARFEFDATKLILNGELAF